MAPDFDDVRVIFRWQGPRVTWQELKTLQQAITELTEVGLTELRERVGDSDQWQFGVMARWQAEAKIARPAKAVGLCVELVKVVVR